MREHLTEADDVVLDYASRPVGLAPAASIIPRRLRASEFRSRMTAKATMGAGGTVACISPAGRSATFLVMRRFLRCLGPRGRSIARALYGATVLLPYLPLLRWPRAETTGRRCVSCIAIPDEIQEGSQS
jgi:hypothetical protein